MTSHSDVNDWQPTASVDALKQRALLVRQIREWFFQQNVLEVETPQLSDGATTDPNIDSFPVADRHLRTSAEFHLKRLLAQGCPDVYELGKVFRVDESGRNHNPEFTMLEWYRLGFDHHQLISDVEALLRHLHDNKDLVFERVSYRDLWKQRTGIDPALTSCNEVANYLNRCSIEVPKSIANNLDALQDLAMGTVIADGLERDRYTCIIDYPASQASLARIDRSNPDWPVANRFEVYYGSVELANGFYELTDGAEQQARFDSDIRIRAQNCKPYMPIDTRFIAALNHGMPDCAGVAVGIDRLMMVLMPDIEALQQVISFDWQRA